MKDLGTDILAQVNDTPFFKKGEALLRYFNK
jgi:hypothetical protein